MCQNKTFDSKSDFVVSGALPALGSLWIYSVVGKEFVLLIQKLNLLL